jgi:methylglutaconyl-CoA hydratase
VNGDLEPPATGINVELRRPPPLFGGEQDPLPRRPQREDPVEPAPDEEVSDRPERVLVQAHTTVAKRRHRRCQGTVDHGGTLSCAHMSALRIERDGGVLRVTLARPERRNAFDAALITELNEAFADVGDARVVVLAGEGEAFCAGADVEWQRASIDLSYEENVADALRLYAMCEAIDRCPAPVVARVHGYALGGGSGLVACSDIVIAASETVFGFTEVRLGIVPAVISPFVLPRIGAHARRYFLTGERFGADVALRIGLVSEVADRDLDERVDDVLGHLLASGPEAVRTAKQLVRDRPGGQAAAEIAAARRTSPEGQDGLRAFLEKRRPAWRSESSS